MIYDIYDDVERALLHGAEKIASCEVTEASTLDSLTDSDFALIIKTASGHKQRKYPIHNSDSSAISEFYFDKVAHSLPQEARAVKFDGSTTYVDMTKVAEVANSVFGVAGKFFPLDTGEQTKTAAANFRIHCADLVPEEKYEYAQNIIKQASVLNLDVMNGDLLSYASPEFSKIAWDRGVAARSMQCDSYEKVAALKDYVPVSSEEAVKYLTAWDKTASMNTKSFDPYKSVHLMLEKTAMEIIPDSKLSKYLDADGIAEYKKDPVAVFKSLPDPVKAALRD